MALLISPGFHFLPSERELVWYLQRKVRGEDDGVVTEVDIYGDKNPWELFDKDVKKDYYVFTKLKKKNMNGTRIDRTAGSGTWKERQTKDQDKNDAHWIRKEYLFELDKKKKKTTEPSDVNGHWNMYEYSLTADGVNANDYVICKIKNKHASQEDYGPGGLEGIERFLAQIRNLKQKPVENQDGAVYNCNKRKLCAVEDGQQQQQLLKKSRTSETLQSAGRNVQQASSDYNVGPSSSHDSNTNLFAVSTVDEIAALLDNVDSFSASTVFQEDQQQQHLYLQAMNNNCCDNFQYGNNGEENLDPTATPVLLLAAEQPLVAESMEQQWGATLLLSEDTNDDQQMCDDPSVEEFYFSLKELLEDDPSEEFCFPDAQSS